MTSTVQEPRSVTEPADGLLVQVCWQDIQDGQMGVTDECPVALALQRALCEYPLVFVEVEHAAITVGYDMREHCFAVDERVAQWLRDFDDGMPVEPFGFRLAAMDPAQAMRALAARAIVAQAVQHCASC